MEHLEGLSRLSGFSDITDATALATHGAIHPMRPLDNGLPGASNRRVTQPDAVLRRATPMEGTHPLSKMQSSQVEPEGAPIEEWTQRRQRAFRQLLELDVSGSSMAVPLATAYAANHLAASRDTVRGLLAALSPAPTPPVLSKDLEALARIVRSVLASAKEDVITQEEANAVIDFIARRFAARRVDEALIHVFKPRHGAWFQLHGEFEP